MVARQFRLREDADVRRVRSRGKACAHGPLVARILPNTLEPAQNRYTVIAGKKSGKSVQRNRLKRITREAIRGFHPFLRQGFDIAIVCRGTVDEMPGLAEAQQTLERIFTRASLFAVPQRDLLPVVGEAITASWSLRRSSVPAIAHETAADADDAGPTGQGADTSL